MDKIVIRPQPNYVAGAGAGLIGGLFAAWVMEMAQAQLKPVLVKPKDQGGEPSTEKAADAVAEAVTGDEVPPEKKEEAGRFLHYATGAALGLVYGALAERHRSITSGLGASFGTGVALGVDETLLPFIGLAPAPDKTSPGQHVYGLASHLVFGVALEGARRLIRGR